MTEPYSNLSNLKQLRGVLKKLIDLEAQIQLFVDDESDEVNFEFLNNIVSSQEDTEQYLDELDELMSGDE